jgi:hypothetical protein
MAIHELLSLGADVVEAALPKAERNPKPPPLTDDEKAQLQAADKALRKRLEQQRRETVRRRAVLDRNSYVITRLHHRYDSKSLPEDIEVQPAASVEGGVALPVGPNAEAPGNVEPSDENRLQTRYSAAHPSKKVVQCEAPTRYRWGKAPPDYRGLRKTWTARDLGYKKRDKFVLKDVIKSSAPMLGIASVGVEPAPADVPAAAAEKDSGCALGPAPKGGAAAILSALPVLALAASLLRRVSRRRKGG